MKAFSVRSLGLALALLAAGLSPVAGEEAVGPGAVALVEGTAIPAEALDAAVEAALVELRMREDALRRQALDELIAQQLFEREAAARGVSVDELVKKEIADRAIVTEEEAKALYETNRSRFGSTPEAKALEQIRAGLGGRRRQERRAAFARELKGKYDVKVLLEPFRLPVEVGEAPVRGNPEAPVTIVEFSDFQCPFCARARPTVNRVREVYGDRVRFAFRHFPLDAIHPQAREAGEAAACAGEQDKFWEMHDRLWAKPGKLQTADLKEHAAALSLDGEAFGRCLDSGRHADLVERDAQAGAGLGVSGTPAFFINGRPLVGAQPFSAFAEVIDDELARLDATQGPSGPAK